MEMSEHGTVEQEIVNVSSKVMETSSVTSAISRYLSCSNCASSFLFVSLTITCLCGCSFDFPMPVHGSSNLPYSNDTIAFLD